MVWGRKCHFFFSMICQNLLNLEPNYLKESILCWYHQIVIKQYNIITRKYYVHHFQKKHHSRQEWFQIAKSPIWRKSGASTGASRQRHLQIIDADDLVNPANERRDLHVDSGNVFAAASKAPWNEASQFVITAVLAN